jgi:diguanylate cyclase (GGDEF)-like protein
MPRKQEVAAENDPDREGDVMALRSSLRGWPVWQLPRWLAACVTAVIAAYAAATAGALASTPVRPGDLRLCAVFVGCGAASVELTRRAGEREGLIRDVYAIWDLSAAVLLPPLYALVIPLPRAVLTEWRIRRTLLHRRAYSTAAHGLAYAAASVVFRSAVPALGGGAGSGGHAPAWITLAAGCGLVSMAVQACLILPPVKATAAPGTRLRSLVLDRDAVCNQGTELCLAVLTAFAVAHSALASVVAIPLVIVLQRSLRHASLAAAARTDAKTGLLNAGAWQREADAEVTRGAQAQTPLAVAIADIDHFKAVNDTYGHLAGDTVLAAVSAAMRDLLRDCDLCGRFGGEEFALLLPRTTAAQALEITERIRQGISQLAIPRDGTAAIQVTISIGVAVPSQARRTLDDLLAAADHALYQAKHSGRDRVIMHADTQVPQASQSLPLARTNVLLG